MLKHKSGPETLYSDCQCDLCGFYLPSQLDGARTGLLICLPLHFACCADIPLVLKDCLFILGFGIFSTGFNALDVCWLCGAKKKKKKGKEENEKASSFTRQFETKFSRRSSKVKDFCLTLSLQTVPPLLLMCSVALPPSLFLSRVCCSLSWSSLELDRNPTRCYLA